MDGTEDRGFGSSQVLQANAQKSNTLPRNVGSSVRGYETLDNCKDVPHVVLSAET